VDQEKQQPANRAQDAIASLESGISAFETFGRVIFFVVLVEVALIMGLNFYQKSRINTYTEKIDQITAEINTPEYSTINTQVEQVLAGSEKLRVALDSKVQWSKFYSQLNAVTPKDVRVTSVSIADGGAVKLDGETASLSSLAKLIVAWNQGTPAATTPFTGVTLASNGYAEEEGSRRVIFSVTGQINTGGLR
jgi:Tfp pilus assembly protein PilN